MIDKERLIKFREGLNEICVSCDYCTDCPMQRHCEESGAHSLNPTEEALKAMDELLDKKQKKKDEDEKILENLNFTRLK